MAVVSLAISRSRCILITSVAEPMNPFTEFTHFGAGSHDALSAIGNSPFASLPSSANASLKSSPANGIQGGHPSLQSRPTVPSYSHFEKHFGSMDGEPQTGEKRDASAMSMSVDQEEDDQTRLAAEEDKRRRNTAASARFRVKKKQREQALEKSAKDMSDKVHNLETRVNELEMENKWLKGMLIERNLAAATIASRNLEQHKAAEDTSVNAIAASNKPAAVVESSTSDKIADQLETQHRKRGIGTAT